MDEQLRVSSTSIVYLSSSILSKVSVTDLVETKREQSLRDRLFLSRFRDFMIFKFGFILSCFLLIVDVQLNISEMSTYDTFLTDFLLIVFNDFNMETAAVVKLPPKLLPRFVDFEVPGFDFFLCQIFDFIL